MYIGPKSRTQRPRKTKIDTEVAHVTRDLDTYFQGQKVKVTRPLCSPPYWRVRRLQRCGVRTCWPWESALLCCRLLGGARRFGAHRGRRGAGHTVMAARLQLVSKLLRSQKDTATSLKTQQRRRRDFEIRCCTIKKLTMQRIMRSQ